MAMAKVLISMPEDLLERVDREAHRRGTSRSELLRSAVVREIGWPDPAALDRALQRGRKALESSGPFESEHVVRSGRDERDERDRRR
jgi:Arc/MetJ-type ribon-helix-helix transcriptional regulator